ncbi:uncharacterized protein LOC101855808 [Aplysia californica]|uniref:Uncharacterized protein LOC101855808 n=1 Tax=Aplysia californica TaxID=6500 RepID=A0ABM1A4B5_APLCA|nr:uncharacterized protein LOC101855808 [Aplysia californica]
MDPITTENSDTPEAENCTGVTSMAEWQSAVCYCDCDQPPIIVEPEYLVLTTDEKVEKIVEELFVDPANTSAAQRKLISADDTRPSARSIGALGITMMVLGLSVSLPVCLFVCLFVCVIVYLSVCLVICPIVCFFECQCTRLWFCIFQPVHRFVNIDCIV